MKHRSNILTLILIITVAIATGSCNRNTVYTHFEPTAADGWRRQDTLHFETEPVKETGTYANTLSLRTTSEYPFRNITMIVERHTDKQGTVRTDTVELELTEPMGNTKGEGALHYMYNAQLTDVVLTKGERLLTSVRHFMIKERLPGISDVGLTVTLRD